MRASGTIMERVAAANTVLKIQESIGRRTGEIKSPSEEAVFARLGASENEVKVALDMARANKSRSLDDHLYNCMKLVPSSYWTRGRSCDRRLQRSCCPC